MRSSRTSPGPVAAHAFSLGLKTGGTLGLVIIWTLYWLDQINLLLAGYALFVLFPVYLVLVAAGLSVWLGYDKGPAALKPVYRQK
ncbi:hypothetical protein [Halorubrum trueperi]|uniref:Uncharacterized protein n=1 Tax=Halorubrum trueperi TaxID=2004704 RepID=A0ABD5UDZ3_9EURY